jgi:hypothetical protein
MKPGITATNTSRSIRRVDDIAVIAIFVHMRSTNDSLMNPDH